MAKRRRVWGLIAVGMVGWWGDCSPRTVSPDQSSDQAITLADAVGVDEPGATLAVAGADGIQDPLTLQIDHDSVDGALVALRIESHAPHDVGAGLGTVLDQSGADGDAGESGEVHLIGVVN